jgi:prolycopene isomerase
VHFKDFLKKSFLREEKGIERIFTAIEEFYRQFDRFAKPDTFRWRSMAFAPLIYPAVFLTSFKTTEQFISKYIKDPQLKGIFTDIWRFLGLAPQRLSALYFLLTIRGYYFRRTSYIRGGSGKLFNAIAEKIKEKGNEVRLNTTVTEIIAEKSGLKTVVSDKGEAFQARTVISNANAVDTLTKLIQDKKLNEIYAAKLARFEKSLSAFQIYLGLKVPAKTLGMTAPLCSINITYDYNENFDFCLKSDFERAPLELVDHVQVDAGLAPAGKGTLLIMTVDNYANWQGLGEPEYKEKKAAYADILIRRAEKYLPGLRENIEVMEIATPLTVERFGAAPEGAIYGFAQTVRQAGFRRLAQDTPIKGLLLAGGWTFPGAGIHGCFVSGVLAANTVLGLLRKDAHHHGYI